MVFFVQFPHPGQEHVPTGDVMSWNTGRHRRKFLEVPGRYVVDGQAPREATLVFWGEWEPPSRVVASWPKDGHLPRYLHRPFWVTPDGDGYRQNTDPWVYGDRFLYSNCKQLSHMNNPTWTQSLDPGSVIAFGSTLQGEFVVDTVFVVASKLRWIPAEIDDLGVDDAFKACVGDSIVTREEHAHAEFTLYRGATWDNPLEGMFSFVPSNRTDTEDPRFARPRLTLEGLINPANTQAPRGKTERHLNEVKQVWHSIRDQVLAQDLLLGIQFSVPPRRSSTSGGS